MGAVNVTATSDDQDEYGSVYFSSFEHYPYSETSTEAFYRGRYSRGSSFSYKHDDLCRVRAKRHKIGRHRHWESNVRAGQVAQTIARDFNKRVLKEPGRLTFSVPVRAEMHSVFNEWTPVGLCLRCCKPHKKKLLVGEVVIIEPFFSGRENKYFSDSLGNCESGISDEDRTLTQAFSHYSWHHSGGKLLVCGLKGRKMDKNYYFRGPTVHSNPVAEKKRSEGGEWEGEGEEQETFGSKDDGLAGIRSFFLNHECNDLCRDFRMFAD